MDLGAGAHRGDTPPSVEPEMIEEGLGYVGSNSYFSPPANADVRDVHYDYYCSLAGRLILWAGKNMPHVKLSGWEKSNENKYQQPVILWFERKNRRWYLVVKGGRLTTAVSSSDVAYNLSPEINEAFTRLFPHIEYDDWRKWKDPVLKKLALIRLKTTLPQNK